jgi:hypothetical protein
MCGCIARLNQRLGTAAAGTLVSVKAARLVGAPSAIGIFIMIRHLAGSGDRYLISKIPPGASLLNKKNLHFVAAWRQVRWLLGFDALRRRIHLACRQFLQALPGLVQRLD